jgi:hypothetical protein
MEIIFSLMMKECKLNDNYYNLINKLQPTLKYKRQKGGK